MLPAASGSTAVGPKNRDERPGTLSNLGSPLGFPSPAKGQTVLPLVCQMRFARASAITNVPSGICASPAGPDIPPTSVRTEEAHCVSGGGEAGPLTDSSTDGTGS